MNQTRRFTSLGRAAGAIFALAFAACGFSQAVSSGTALVGRTTFAEPDRVFRAAPSPSVDPASFVPRVATGITARGLRPANPKPVEKLRELFAPNPLSVPGVPAVGSSVQRLRQSSPSSKFPGIGFTGAVPPDPHIAVGSDFIVQVVNTDIGFFRKSDGRLVFRRSLGPSGFFSGVPGVGSFVFDPRVVYDPASGRFVVVVLDVDFDTNQSHLLLAVSSSGNPNDPWFRYRIDNEIASPNTWGDYPTLTVNRDYIAVSTNHFTFGPGGSPGSQILLLDKAPMLSGGIPTVSEFRTSDFSVSLSRKGDSGDQPVFGVVLNSRTTLAVHAYFREGGVARTARTIVAMPNHLPQFDGADTNGFLLDAIGLRMMDVYIMGDSLTWAFTANIGPDNASSPAFPTQSKIRWGQIDVNNWPSSGLPVTVQAGDLALPGSNSALMPSIAENANGVIAVVGTGSGPDLTPLVIAGTRRETDPSGVLTDVQVLANSPSFRFEAPGAVSRWGDYSGVQPDPVDPRIFWGTAQVWRNANLVWGTEIASFLVDTGPVNLGSDVLSVERVFGTLSGGNAASFAEANDDDQYQLLAEFVNGRGMYAGYDLVFNPGVDRELVNAVQGTVLTSINQPLSTGFIYAFNTQTSQWVLLRTQRLGAGVQSSFSLPQGSIRQYVGSDGSIRVRVVAYRAFRRVGSTLTPFRFNSDFARLTINPRSGD